MHGMMSKQKSNLNIPYYIYIYIYFFQYTVKSLDVEETKFQFLSIIIAVTCSQTWPYSEVETKSWESGIKSRDSTKIE